jgi:uncharacterized protein YdaU (DUF1376 family)
LNYYEHHLGDYDSATSHLSWLEDCAYRRLICLYYRTEAALPLDPKQVCRLVRAATKPERDAVLQVLHEFFQQRGDGWHNARCDADIAQFHELEPEREAKRENAKERQRRARERRAELFTALRGHDIVPAYDTTTKALEALLSQVTSRVTGAQPATAPVTPVTCDNTATHTHYPLPTTQLPKEIHTHTTTVVDPPAVAASGVLQAAMDAFSAMRLVGISDGHAGHPDLLALVTAGAIPAEFQAAAKDAVDRGKGFAYAIGALKRQRVNAAQTLQAMHRGELPAQETPAQRQARETVEAFTGGRVSSRRPGSAAGVEVIDV